MQIADYAEVMDLWRRCEGVGLRDSDSPAGIERYLLRNPGLSFVAVDGVSMVGTIMAGHDGKRGYIQHLAVDRNMRSKGIGGRLVELCLEALKSEGVVKSHVHVFESNVPGRDFWRGHGWMHRSEIVVYSFINGENKNA